MNRSNARVMWRMLGLARPLAGWMVLAVACGVAGFCCATGIPVLASAAALAAAGKGTLAWGLPAAVAGRGQAATTGAIMVLSTLQLLLAVDLASAGAVTAEGAVLAVVATFSSFGPFVALANLGSTLQGTLAAGNRVLDILDEEPQVAEVLDDAGTHPAFTGSAAEHVGFSYADERILDDASMSVEPGRIVAVQGRSGSGKSTFLNLIGGLEGADGGAISVGGCELTALSSKDLGEYRRRELGFVFQFYNLVPDLTIRENIEVTAHLSADPLPMEDLLRSLGLWEHRDKFPRQVSGGQQQRCAPTRTAPRWTSPPTARAGRPRPTTRWPSTASSPRTTALRSATRSSSRAARTPSATS